MKSKTANVGRASTPFPGDFDTFARMIDAVAVIYHNQVQKNWLGGLTPG